MAYLYKELGKAERAECDRHLKGCPECQAEMERWRTGMEWLDHDSASLVIAQGKNVVRFWQQPMLRWAAAAAVILTSGFAMGRLSQPSNDDLDKKLAEMREVIRRHGPAPFAATGRLPENDAPGYRRGNIPAAYRHGPARPVHGPELQRVCQPG